MRVGRADCHDALHKVCESLEAYTWIGSAVAANCSWCLREYLVVVRVHSNEIEIIAVSVSVLSTCHTQVEYSVSLSSILSWGGALREKALRDFRAAGSSRDEMC